MGDRSYRNSGSPAAGADGGRLRCWRRHAPQQPPPRAVLFRGPPRWDQRGAAPHAVSRQPSVSVLSATSALRRFGRAEEDGQFPIVFNAESAEGAEQEENQSTRTGPSTG